MAVTGTVNYGQDTHLAIINLKLRPGNYSLVITTGVTDFKGQALSQEYSTPLVVATETN
jgi:hypothetical protein